VIRNSPAVIHVKNFAMKALALLVQLMLQNVVHARKPYFLILLVKILFRLAIKFVTSKKYAATNAK